MARHGRVARRHIAGPRPRVLSRRRCRRGAHWLVVGRPRAGSRGSVRRRRPRIPRAGSPRSSSRNHAGVRATGGVLLAALHVQLAGEAVTDVFLRVYDGNTPARGLYSLRLRGGQPVRDRRASPPSSGHLTPRRCQRAGDHPRGTSGQLMTRPDAARATLHSWRSCPCPARSGPRSPSCSRPAATRSGAGASGGASGTRTGRTPRPRTTGRTSSGWRRLTPRRASSRSVTGERSAGSGSGRGRTSSASPTARTIPQLPGEDGVDRQLLRRRARRPAERRRPRAAAGRGRLRPRARRRSSSRATRSGRVAAR